MITRRFVFLATTALTLTVLMSGYFVASSAIPQSFVETETQEEEKMMVTSEMWIIFSNGTRIHRGPYSIPCHVEEVTERGLVVVPDYSLPPLPSE